MGRTPCCDKAKVKRGPWSPEEDAVLKGYIESHGTGGNWIALPQKAGLKRCGKSCRLRWLNYLRPDIKHGGFTKEEDDIIWRLYNNIGSRWSVIASQLPGRTDNDVKNYWNTKLKKRMMVGNQVTTATAAAAVIDDTFNQINQTPANMIPAATVKSEAPVEPGFSFGPYNSFPVDASEQDTSNWWINDEFLFDFGSRFPVEFLSSSSSAAHETTNSFDAETKLQVT